MGMSPEVKKLWIEALRSGEYRQGRGTLRAKRSDGRPDLFCCLGVLCDLAVKNGVDVEVETYIDESFVEPIFSYGGHIGRLPRSVISWSGIGTDVGILPNEVNGHEQLTTLNDDGASFWLIAKIIEEQF